MQQHRVRPTLILETSMISVIKEEADKGLDLDWEAFKELVLATDAVLTHPKSRSDIALRLKETLADSSLRLLETEMDSNADDLTEFASLLGCDPKSLFLLANAFTLSFFCKLEEQDSGIQTLFFHAVKDASQWLLANPIPEESLNENINKGAKLLSEGKLVAFPTETVYGLGADATNAEAARSIFAAKQRPFFDPLIVHIASFSQLAHVVQEVPDQARALMEKFWPGPLTLVLAKKETIPPIVTGNSETVAVRMPSNPIARALIERSGTCIAAPSANKFGYTSPTTAEHVRSQLGERIDAIIDGGASTVGIESTVLSLVAEVPTLLRPGQVSIEELTEVLGMVLYAKKEGPIDTHMESPGLLESHYAPNTPLLLVEDVSKYADQQDVGVILFEQTDRTFAGPVTYISRSKNPLEAASKLYWAIRKLDGMNLKFMVASLLEDKGIGSAINNRLKKASAKH